ncbi:hypothetical protein MKW92_044639 [Papaver armeniacum]|nr:hypothetical protein MKW92_044639 [Papaver armeniacum]
MSLALLQGYSSAEEEEEQLQDFLTDSDEDEDVKQHKQRIPTSYSRDGKPLFDPNPASTSILPSAFEIFSEVAGPPQFLNNCVGEQVSTNGNDGGGGGRGGGRRGGHGRMRREKKDLPAGVVMEAKAQLVGIRDRVSSDGDGLQPPISSQRGSTSVVHAEGKRVVTATNPDAKDAADLLRMCLQCGIPKTFTNARGMFCPQCGDRPPVDKDAESEKKKGSTIKDKEKNKRMKGQSSHSSWKSETEMHLRQQFD